MLKFQQQCDPKAISLTGVRAIVILALLCKQPCSFEEIKNFLIVSNIVNKEYSIDTIRMDLNTLKYIGCEITKATKTTNNKYVLTSHPFQLNWDSENTQTLVKIYKNVYKNLPIETIFEYDDLFNKLSKVISNDSEKEALKCISVLKKLDKELLKELINDIKQQNKIQIEYFVSPQKTVNYDITVQSLGFRNRKLYVYCYNHTKKVKSFLNFSRLKLVCARYIHSENLDVKNLKVKFKLNNYKTYQFEDNEKIISKESSTAIIEGTYFNHFIMMQRILSFASDCIIIEPQEVKDKLKDNLENMRALYD